LRTPHQITVSHPFRHALGQDSRQRLRIKRMLIAAGVYLSCTALQWYGVWVGYTTVKVAGWFSLFMGLGLVGFYVTLRSGLNLRFAEPALTLPQSVFGLLSLAAAYVINPRASGAMLMVAALVLVFSAFTLPPRMCRRLSWIATAVLGAAMCFGMWEDPDHFDAPTEFVRALLMLAVLPTIGVLTGQLSRIRFEHHRQRRELKEALARLRQLAMHDELTGLPNRRHLHEWMQHEVARSRRIGAPLCLALMDIDHFKKVNDTLGHEAGDTVLRIFAQEARSLLREGDMLARWGGEEFMLVMPDSDLAVAERVLARLREHLAQPQTWADFPEGQVTFSAGLTMQLQPQSLEAASRLADAALYEAKRLGRDRVVQG
jgi:diguanylate cyclase (GGDEF)-like protein